MNKELFYEIILFAEENGYKGHLGMLPLMPICKTSADSLAKAIFWGRRFEIIFSHDFARAIWGKELSTITITNPVVDNHFFESISVNVELKKYENFLQRMVLKKDPFQYLKEYYEKIQSN